MIDTKDMRANRAKMINDAQAIARKAVDEKRSLTAAEREQTDKIMADEAILGGDIERYEKMNASEAALGEVRSTIGREGNGTVKPADRKPDEVALDAWRSFLINGREDMPADLFRALTLSGTSGYTAPQLAQTSYIEVLRNFTDMRQLPITVLPTGQGNDIPWPSWDDTANSAGNVTGENTDVGTAGDPTLAQIVLKAYMVPSGVLKVSRQFLQDSVMPVEQVINEQIAKRIGAKQNAYYTTGTGTSQPQGLVTGIPAGQIVTLTAGHTAALGTGADNAAKSQDLVNNLNAILHKVKKVYRQRGKTGFMLADSTAQHLKTYVDSTGRGLWQPSLVADQPDMLNGWPVWTNDDMDAIGVTKKVVVFGNFSMYYVRDVGNIAIDRLVERYAEFLLVGFNGYHRTDSKVMDGNAFAVLQTSAT